MSLTPISLCPSRFASFCLHFCLFLLLPPHLCLYHSLLPHYLFLSLLSPLSVSLSVHICLSVCVCLLFFSCPRLSIATGWGHSQQDPWWLCGQPAQSPPHHQPEPLTSVQHRAKDGQAVHSGAVPAAATELVLALLDTQPHTLCHAGHDLHVVPAEAQLLGHQARDASTQHRVCAQGRVLGPDSQGPGRWGGGRQSGSPDAGHPRASLPRGQEGDLFHPMSWA